MNIKRKIYVTMVLSTILISLVSYVMIADENTEIGIISTAYDVELGDSINTTVYLNPGGETVTTWKIYLYLFNQTELGLVNCSSVEFSGFWNTGFNDYESINNDTGNITDIQSFDTTGTTNNETACYINFTTNKVGVLYLNISDFRIDDASGEVTAHSENNTVTIHPVEPAGLTATMTSDTEISLSGFSSGEGGDYTVIRRDTGDYPSNPQSGTEVYNDTGSSTNDSSLTKNTTYYYRAWTYNDTENIFSIDYFQDTATTNEHPINSNPNPANDADNQSLNPTLSIDLYDYNDASQDMNATFYTNESGSWVEIGSNNSVNSGTYQQTPTQFDSYNTRYYWSVNTTDGINWDNDTYFFDTDPDDAANATNPYPADDATGIDLTPNCHVDIADDEGSTDIVVCFYTNESGSWELAQKNTSVSDSDTVYWTFTNADIMNTRYWWNVSVDDGTNNETYGPWDFTTFNLAISNEYPSNESTGGSRPETNLSAYCAGSGMNVYIYLYNMTPVTDTWTLLDSWMGQSSGRFEVLSFYSNDLKWGNTGYNWSVNITDGNGNWVNNTYEYHTVATVDGSNARYDVNNDDTVDVFDLNNCWTNRDGEANHDGIYDVNYDTDIDVFDLNNIWSNRS